MHSCWYWWMHSVCMQGSATVEYGIGYAAVGVTAIGCIGWWVGGTGAWESVFWGWIIGS